MPNIAFLNGKFMPLAMAKVHVEDRGYQFGDGVYELIRTYSGRLFSLDDHLARMEKSAAEIGLNLHYNRRTWKRIITRAHQKSRFPNARIYIQVTRGVAPRNHLIPKKIRPTTLVTVRRFDPLPVSVRRKGVSIITLDDIRWGRCDLKSINLLANILAKDQARSRGAFEAIFIRNGWLTEGSTSNIFAMLDGALITPPSGPNLLAGITRDIAIQLASEIGLEVKERDLSLDEAYRAEEVFLTGTTIEILPVVKINGRPVGSGRPGSVAQHLYSRFEVLSHK